ncbi:hypothetical protein HQ545_05435 [Candidatus Woesearchaeota archaeon]|nr:hypothetical protein [Candidatus Woesearchaeota archaeon]
MYRCGQVWYTDFIIGVMIFSFMIGAYFYYVGHGNYYEDDPVPMLVSEAKRVTSYLLTEGYPANWTLLNVSTVGLTNGRHRMDNQKLGWFNSWDYEERRGYFHTTKDYYFYLEHKNGTVFNKLCKDPLDGCVDWNSSYYLVQNTRLLIYDGSIVRMVYYVYQQN